MVEHDSEEQTTYSVTLENLALGNGETNGETGGAVGGGGADGENDGGTTPTTTRGYSQITVTQITQMEFQNIDACTEKKRSRKALSTVCTGQGTILCTPGVVPTTRWSAWKLTTKDEDGCQ